ncbi:MAG: Panacea domain-containing protein [Fusobacteriaceae bacterium]
MTAKDIANYFLTFTNEDFGDVISNLKLQKLVYYAQGFHLALYDEPLFSDKIYAWQHGPVVESLYHDYKNYGSNGIPVPEINLDSYSVPIKELLNSIYEIYGQFSAWKLRDMTHEESPWNETSLNYEITPDCLKRFFITRIDND